MGEGAAGEVEPGVPAAACAGAAGVLAEGVAGVELLLAAAAGAAEEPACVAGAASAFGLGAGEATGALATAPGTAGLVCFDGEPFGAAGGRAVLVTAWVAAATGAGCAGLGAGGGICTV